MFFSFFTKWPGKYLLFIPSPRLSAAVSHLAYTLSELSGEHMAIIQMSTPKQQRNCVTMEKAIIKHSACFDPSIRIQIPTEHSVWLHSGSCPSQKKLNIS